MGIHIAGVLALVMVRALSAQEAVPSTTAPALTAAELAPQVLAIFDRSCASCHDVSRRAKPKADFGHVLDLPRLAADEDYVTAGLPGSSSLYQVLVTDDEDERMPPPQSDAPKLSEPEIQIVRDWITALAAPAPVAVAQPIPVVAPAEPVPKAAPSPGTIFARTHVMLVHFPVALLLLAAAVDWLSLFLRRSGEWVPSIRLMLGVSAAFAILSVGTGWFLAGAEGFQEETVFIHRWLGVLTAAAAVLGWGAMEWAIRAGDPRLGWLARALLTLAALAVALAGHTGGELVYGAGYPFNP